MDKQTVRFTKQVISLKLERCLELRFANKKLREVCERQAIARRQLGDVSAHKLRTRLADLDAADHVSDLVAGRPHALAGKRLGQYAVDLAGGARLVFAPANDPVPRRPDRSIDWSVVTIICIEYIDDYHE